MKIAIIGGGLFGTHTASEISKLKNVESIHLFEKADQLFTGASSNNQHRMHLGFHYPRSPETISQITEVSEEFINLFRDCLFDIKDNFYFITNTSKISFQQYKYIYLNNSEEIDLNLVKEYLYIDKITGGIRCNEMGINIKQLKKKLLENLNKEKITVFLNSEWKEQFSKDYDFVINCSYTDLKQTTDTLKVKYELCDLVLIKNPFEKINNYSFTIMDGLFSSLYATENTDIFTLSNVEKTPFFKTNDLNELNYAIKNINENDLKFYDEQIIEKSKEFFKFNNIEIVGRYLCPKTKIFVDENDIRTTQLLFENKNITILQGKISTIQYVSDAIKQHLGRI